MSTTDTPPQKIWGLPQKPEYTPVLNEPRALIRSRLKGGIHFGPDPRVAPVRHKLFRASLEELTAFAARVGINLPNDCDTKGAAKYLWDLEKRYHKTENPIVEDVVDLAAWDKDKFEPADFRGGAPAAPHALDIRPGESPEVYQARLMAYAQTVTVTSAPTTIPATPPKKPDAPQYAKMSYGDLQSWCMDNEISGYEGCKDKAALVAHVKSQVGG